MKARILMLVSSHIHGVEEAIQFFGGKPDAVHSSSGIIENHAIELRVVQMDKGQPLQTYNKLRGCAFDMAIVAPSLEVSLRKGGRYTDELFQEIRLIQANLVRHCGH